MSFPCFIQRDAKDCGPTCLRIIAKYYGKNISLTHLRDKCYTLRTGTTLYGISSGAEFIGLKTIGLKLTWNQLVSSANLPCIIHWNSNHFIVVYKIHKNKVYVSDPGHGLLRYDKDIFLKSWMFSEKNKKDGFGAVLLLTPTPLFYSSKEVGDNSKLNLLYILNYLKPYKKYFLNLLSGIILGSLISLIFPLLSQSVVDVGISDGDLNFIILILIAQVILTFGQTANNFIKNWLLLHITSRISISLISDFLAKLMRLPIAFFDTKMVGDILQRMTDFDKVQNFLTGSLLSILMAAISLLVYGGIMANYNVTLLLIFFIGSILYVTWVLLFLKHRRRLDYMRFQQASGIQTNLIQLITGMQEIKLNNCENKKRWEWEGFQAKLYKINMKSLALQQWQESGAVFVDNLKNVLISFIAAKSVIDGNMSLGMMMSMQYIIGQLNAPISQFIGFVKDIQDARISLERLNEIQEKEDEEPIGKNLIQDIPLNEDINLKNVSFRYPGALSPNVLCNITFSFKHNKTTAIVGASGNGKTTLLKLLLGFYEPTEGEVLLGSNPLSSYSDCAWRKTCGVVMQEGFLFSDTIENNISLSDEEVDSNKLEKAVNMACIGGFIKSLPWGYNTKIGAEGHGLSTGQKQRLLIARAVYKNSPYIIFDEATNSLDANNELQIIRNLNAFFVNRTVIIVAHRLSTVKRADNIIVLDGGRIVEEGNHDNLTAKKGYYYNLIKNQLELGV